MPVTVHRSIAAVALLVPALLGASLPGASPAAAETTEIAAAARLSWGFKTSWRVYAPLPATSDGAEAGGEAPYQVSWPFESGSYDAEARTTTVRYGGSVHWQKYRASSELGWTAPAGYEGEPDPYLLDVTLSEPEITISGDRSTITAHAVSRDKSTWELIDYGRIPIVDLDVLDVAPTIEGGTTSWADITATVAAEGTGAFDDTYPDGTVVDDVGFSYTGPGGAPDFSEHFDAPGSVALQMLRNRLFVESSSYVSLDMPSWVDRDNLIVHSSYAEKVEGVNSRRLQAFDLEKMEPVGEPWIAPNSEAPLNGGGSRVVAYDTSQNRLLYRANSETGVTRWLRYDVDAEEYESGLFTDPQLTEPSFVGEGLQVGLAWDQTRDRGYRVERVVPEGVEADDYDNHEWKLITYAEGEGGVWEKNSFDLAGFGPGQSQTGYAQSTSFADPAYATAADGSLIVLATARETSTDPSNPVPATVPAAYRLVIDDDAETVAVQPLPAEVENINSAGYTAVQATADGHLLLTRNSGTALHCQIAGDAVECDPPLAVEDEVEVGPYSSWHFAVDPLDGTVWYSGDRSRQLAAFRDGEFVGGRHFDELNARNGPLLIGADHAVYAQTNDGSPTSAIGSTTWGFGEFERLGFAPRVDTQPQAAAATLGSGEESAAVSFSSTAGGEPGPTRQWQVREPGSLRFVDLDGETAETLTVSAERGMDGTEYRAVYENDAGRVASEAATLSVEYAPVVTLDPASTTVSEGTVAELSVLADGNPEPTVQWQRRVDGYWQPIAAADDNFELTGASLTVLDTNTEQTGSLFRAKLVNPVGTTYSEQAKLSVEPRVSIPDEGVDLDHVSLEWSGNAEMQKAPPFGGSNYFSAAASDGSEATYSAATGDVRVFQVSAGGEEILATYATRAAHVSDEGSQLVRVYGGSGRVEADGSATVAWEGSFSVNFYGGLVPFTFLDPRLEVAADGDGTLSATMVGCGSSQAEPDVCAPFAAHSGVTVATFSGVEVDPAGAVEIDPDYAGVEVELPEGETPQNRSVEGWGAWPHSLVDFQVQTGLAAYWYTSGSAFDADKPPLPFVVDFAGEALPAAPAGGDDGAVPLTVADPAPAPVTARAPRLARLGGKRGATVGRDGTVSVLRVQCRGPLDCVVRTRARATVVIAGKRYRAKVIAPSEVAAGKRAAVRLRMPEAARRALARERGSARVWVGVRSGERTVERKLRVVLRRGGGGIAVRRISRSVGETGWLAIGGLRCGAATPCAVGAPAKVATKVGGKLIRARVIGPRQLAPRRAGKLKLKLSQGALARLSDHTAKLRVKVELRAGKGSWARLIVVELKRRVGGSGAGSGPESEPIANEPPLLARPATAVDVSAVELTWYPRDSWIRYASTGVGAGDGIMISGGATGVDSTASACPDRPSESDAELPYEVRFTPRASWYDPPSGTAGIYGQGRVHFRWKAHTIDLAASEPEIEIDGPASRAIFRFAGSEGTPYPDQRADLVSLDLAGQPTVTNGGKTFSYDLVRGTLTENGVNVFAGFYTPPDNDEFGCLSVSFTTP